MSKFPTYYRSMKFATSHFFSRLSIRQATNCLRRGLLAVCTLLMPMGFAAADVREVTGEFLFGPDMGVTPACEAAEQKAKQEALRQVLGERFSVSEQLSCREGRAGIDNTDCVYNTFLWSEIDGDIKEAQRLGEPLIDKQPGASRCQVRMRVVVDVPSVVPDPGFDFQASLNAIRLRANESVAFTVRPSVAMHMAVFSWAPSHDRTTVARIFPNSFDTSGLFQPQQVNQIPSEQGARRYGFQVSFPSNVKQDFVDEYLIFVATKRPVPWLTQYTFEQFRARLREISPADKRVVKHSYRIIN